MALELLTGEDGRHFDLARSFRFFSRHPVARAPSIITALFAPVATLVTVDRCFDAVVSLMVLDGLSSEEETTLLWARNS